MASEYVKGAPQLQARLHAIDPSHMGSGLMRRLALSTVREAKLAVPRKTGNLGRSIHIVRVTTSEALVEAGAHYAAYVEKGTGLYGPAHRRITPKAAKALRWMGGPAGSLRLTGARRSGKAGAGAGWIYARSTKGSPAQPFLLPGAQKAVSAAGLASEIVKDWNAAA